MIKQDTSNIIAVEPATIGDDVLDFFSRVSHSDMNRLSRDVETLEREVRQVDVWVANMRRQVNEAYREMYRRVDRRTRYARDLKRAKRELAAIDDTEHKQAIADKLELVRKLRYVEKIEQSRDAIVIHTRLIFTDVRKESGSREYVRRCIGAFRIDIDFAASSFKIANSLFSRMNNPHWTVGSRGNPCYGEHEDYFRDALSQKDLYMLLEYIYAFLRSTDDSAAYLPSDSWIDERKERYERRGTPRLRKGNYVIVTNSYEQYDPTRHPIYAEVVRTDNGSIYLQFKSPWEYGHSMRGLVPEGTGYRVSDRCVLKISKREFDAETMTLQQARAKSPLDELDSLPFGSTLSDANKII